jgi:hypothetical protein
MNETDAARLLLISVGFEHSVRDGRMICGVACHWKLIVKEQPAEPSRGYAPS